MDKAEKKEKEGIQLTIIEKIEALMNENNINQATLAREINIGQAQLSKCLSRKGSNYIGIDTLIKLSDYFKVTVDHLLGRTSLTTVSKQRSNTDICRNLINLIETNAVNIVTGSVDDCNYKMFYFSNYLSAPKTKKKNLSGSKSAGNDLYHPKGIEINAFIEYYLKLRELNKKNELPQAFFEQAIEDRLNQMRY